MSREIIGIDHGWSGTKTSHTSIVSGVAAIATEPAFFDDVLEVDGKYYKIGSSRLEVKNTKIEDNSFYLLTLASMAKELKHRGVHEADIVIAGGLPATRYGDEKQGFIEYLSKRRELSFNYEKEHYSVRITRVFVFPQCYAAIADKVGSFPQKVIAVDIGSWTIDIIPIVNKRPDEAGENTIPEGLITCMHEINKECVRRFNEQIDESDIQEFIITGETQLPDEYRDVMEAHLKSFANKVYNSLRELGYGLKTSNIIFVGGGAAVMKRFGGYEQKNIKYDLDICANAKGFELLAKAALAKEAC